MIAAILSTGTELTRGELANTNATWLAAELSQLGVTVTAIDTVDDNRERISQSFHRLTSNHDLVVCTGGLGPTTDDVTAESLAAAANVELQFHDPSLQAITARLARAGRKLTESNAKQARVPAGCTVLPNHHGTAPGFRMKLNRANVYCLPGVPAEMKPMFSSFIVPAILDALQSTLAQVVVRTFGVAESAVNDALSGIAATHGVTLGYRVHFPELAVKVLAVGLSETEAAERAARAAEAVCAKLGDRVVYGQNDVTIAGVLCQKLRENGLRLGIAESCTGGLASAILTEQPGVSDVFSGAIVAYTNEVKATALGVPAELIKSEGAVSKPVALAMAEGARRAFRCEVGLSITGVAGPTGATAEKPLGTVHFAVAGPNFVRHHHRVINWERARFQRMAAFVALNWMRCLLYDQNAEPP